MRKEIRNDDGWDGARAVADAAAEPYDTGMDEDNPCPTLSLRRELEPSATLTSAMVAAGLENPVVDGAAAAVAVAAAVTTSFAFASLFCTALILDLDQIFTRLLYV